MNNKEFALVGKIILEDRILEEHAVLMNETIHEIVPVTSLSSDIERVYTEGYIAPGFIDIHIHGGGGYDVMDGTREALETIAKTVVQSGTTSMLATTMTMSQAHIEKSLGAIQSYMDDPCLLGANILGAHLEGPFINPEYKGAQDPQYIQKPRLDWLKPYLPVVKIITYAPEMDEAFAFTKALKDSDIVLSIGHSGSDFETALAAYDQGVDHITHCFNAMTGLHHRKPGIVGAAFTKPFTTEIITDGIHVHTGFLETFVNIKTVDKTILVTDAIRANFLPEGEYELGGQPVTVKDGKCTLEDGTIAGSIHKMDSALRNMKHFTNYSLVDIVKMLSLNPAKRLKIDNHKGSIAAGKDADIAVFSPQLEIEQVYIKGKLAYKGDN